jgi:hypothetical protein
VLAERSRTISAVNTRTLILLACVMALLILGSGLLFLLTEPALQGR